MFDIKQPYLKGFCTTKP